MKQMFILKILLLQSRYKRGIGIQGDIDWGLYHSRHGCPFLMRGTWKREGRMKMEVSKSHSRYIDWGSSYRRNWLSLCMHTHCMVCTSQKRSWTGGVHVASLLFHQTTLLLNAASGYMIARYLLFNKEIFGEVLPQSSTIIIIFFKFLNTMGITHILQCVSVANLKSP